MNIELQTHCDSLFDFMNQELKFDSKPEIIFAEIDNAEDFLADTGQYDAENFTITVYTSNRHPKDVLRSVAHELVHHKQNEAQKIKGQTYAGYAQSSPELRKLEEDAFLRGNMLFRDWSDSVKLQQKSMNESYRQFRNREVNKAVWEKFGLKYPTQVSFIKESLSPVQKQNNRIKVLTSSMLGNEMERNYTLEMDAAFDISEFLDKLVYSFSQIANDTAIKGQNLSQAVLVKAQNPIKDLLINLFSPSATMEKIDSAKKLSIALDYITKTLPLKLQKLQGNPQVRGAAEVAFKNVIEIVAQYKETLGNLLEEEESEFQNHRETNRFLEKIKSL